MKKISKLTIGVIGTCLALVVGVGLAQGPGNYFTYELGGQILKFWSGSKLQMATGSTLQVDSGATFTVADGALAAGDVALARGSIIAGNSSGVGAALDAKGSGKILVGDGTDVASVAVSGDATLAANGAVTVAKLAGAKYIAGLATTASASDTVASGLATVVACVCSLDSDPVDDPLLVSCDVGDQAGSPAAGSFYLNTWKTDGADPTPSAATTFSKSVAWFCKGT